MKYDVVYAVYASVNLDVGDVGEILEVVPHG
jgi:hypothetical protein